MAKSLFELKEVYFSYLGKIPALCGVNLSIEKGVKVAVIGANGTGKSTLLALLDALMFADRGTVEAFGQVVSEGAMNDLDFVRDFRRKVGFVFQNPDIQLFCPTVREDIAFGLLQLGVSADKIKERIAHLSSVFDIGHLLERQPHQLSIGEKRKVAIASVLAIDPEVLLLDEPTAGLDPLTTCQIIDLLAQESRKGKTIVTATHDLHIVREIADEAYVFSRDKRIVRKGTPQEILTDTEFLTTHNLVHIHCHQHEDKTHTHPHLHAHTDHHAA